MLLRRYSLGKTQSVVVLQTWVGKLPLEHSIMLKPLSWSSSPAVDQARRSLGLLELDKAAVALEDGHLLPKEVGPRIAQHLDQLKKKRLKTDRTHHLFERRVERRLAAARPHA